MASLSLSFIELSLLLFVAIVLGVTIHFFLSSRRSLKTSGAATEKVRKSLDDWKLKYFSEMELKDRELSGIKQQLAESEEERNINSIEIEEQRRHNKLLKTELERLQKNIPQVERHDYLDQLKQAQQNLKEQHEIINQLFEQIDDVKVAEEKQKGLVKSNEELSEQVSELKTLLYQREKELSVTRQKETMSKEMTSMLDNAYSEFSILQEKIQKLESDAGSANMLNMEHANLKESYYKLQKDFEDQKLKLAGLTTQNQNLATQLAEAEENFKESDFQRHQLQKRVVYLEELNKDFQMIADANKKLEVQIKHIGELESMLNVVSEERDNLARNKMNTE